MKRILTFLFLFSSLFASSQTQYIGAPNTTVVARGNMKVDSILYLPKREKTPTDTGALHYQISDSSLYVWTGSAWRKAKNDGTVTSVGLTMPTAFAVANSPVTSAGTLAVTATGSATEYIRGDGTLGTLPTSGGGGGSGVNYYLNGSVSQGTIGGSTYYEMSKTPIVGTGTNFTAAADGLIQQFITDAGDPNRLLIPAGAWNFELYFSASSAGGTPTFYVELLKYDGTTFTSIASSSASPQAISNGTTKTLYFTSLAVSETVLTATDRLAIRVYVAVSGRTITFYTEDANLAEIITTFAGGVVSLNGLTANDQFFATGTTGTNFNIASTSATHTFNLPTASATNRGALSSTDWTTFNNKVNISDTSSMLTNYIRHGGYGLTKTGQALIVDTSAIATRSRVQKGIDSLGLVKQNVITNPVTGTGTTNYLSKWTGTSTQAISQIFDNGTNLGIGTSNPNAYSNNAQTLTILGTSNTATGDGLLHLYSSSSQGSSLGGGIVFGGQDGVNSSRTFASIAGLKENSTSGNYSSFLRFATRADGGSVTERLRITSAGDVAIGNTSPAYKLDVTGTLRNTTGAAFATSSGNVLIGTTVDGGVYKLDVQGALRNTTGANFATSSGNVGIGTTSTLGRFHVRNDAGYNTVLSSLGGYSGIFSVNDANAYREMRIDGSFIYMGGFSGGETYIGTGTLDAGNYKLQVKGQMHSTGLTSVAVDSGSLTVGTTTSGGNKVNVEGSMAVSGLSGFAITSGNVGIGQTGGNATEKIDINGRARVRTIDSTATGMNMLYADATGVIKKAAVPSGGGGSVTSITAGTGLTGGTITTSGTIAVDTASIATRARVQKGIDSVTTLANTKLSGTGISGYFPKWTGTSTQDTSQLFQLGRNIGIGTATPTYRIHLPDAGNTANQAMLAGTVFGSDGNGQTIKPSDGAMALFGQSDVGYLYGSVVSSTGRWGVNTRSVNDATFSVDGSVKIVTIDSTSTARNMLYQDANGVIKKSAIPSGGITGSGTASYLPKWTSGSAIGNSVAYDNGGELLISTTEDAGDFKLQVAGAIYTTSTISTGGVNGETSKTWKLGSRRAAAVSLDATQYLEVEVNGVLYYIAMITIN